MMPFRMGSVFGFVPAAYLDGGYLMADLVQQAMLAAYERDKWAAFINEWCVEVQHFPLAPDEPWQRAYPYVDRYLRDHWPADCPVIYCGIRLDWRGNERQMVWEVGAALSGGVTALAWLPISPDVLVHSALEPVAWIARYLAGFIEKELGR